MILHFFNLKVWSKKQDGCIFWNGKNQRPNTNACVNLNQIEIN
jgi:hypothetical protein